MCTICSGKILVGICHTCGQIIKRFADLLWCASPCNIFLIICIKSIISLGTWLWWSPGSSCSSSPILWILFWYIYPVLHIVFCYWILFCLAFQEVVSQNCVVIFSKTTCPYCKMAKNVFNEIGATYKVIELDEHNDGRRLQEALAQMTGARTVRASCCILGSWFKITSKTVSRLFNNRTETYLTVIFFLLTVLHLS